ncbi:transcriptional regulator NrdR [Candidatus Woesearchaeota archaeon]|nr:transcriptional regulator NrdR [Candidatus Woesearchaeota archaeon]MBW3013790.1 transcriptional regulator NrdR [Candidatus Woesearchaeota archaeon]
MKCPYCSSEESKVVDKRETTNDDTRRRRECLKCGKRYTTYERIENFNVTIIKKDGKREVFDREKLLKGILKACEKRPVSREEIQKGIDTIETKIKNYDEPEVPSKVIGEEVIKLLAELDKVAYIRFASVYREFADVNTFIDEINKVLKK